jgi:hypothetical protein
VTVAVIRLLALGGRTIRIFNPATSIIAVAPVEHGQAEGNRRIQAEVWLSSGQTLWVCESVDEVERLILGK